MTVEMAWFIENKVVYCKISGAVTESELTQLDSLAIQWFDQSPESSIHILVDAQQVTQTAPLAAQSKLQFPKHAKLGWIVAGGSAKSNVVVRMIVSLVSQFFKVRWRDERTLDEALAFLQEIDSSLPDLKTIPIPSELVTPNP